MKVAFFPMDGYHIKEADGSYSGMDVEYLNAVCEYVDWEIEYVECDSWEEALTLLEEKKVDLVGSAQYSEERAELYQYADLSSGYTFGAIATGSGSDLAYEDFTAMQDITYGMVQGYVRRDEFLQYLADNGIYSPQIIEYESTAALQNALEVGEIEALVHTFTEVREGQRLLGRFAPRPFYYITYQGNDDVVRELNYAIADLKINAPEMETELMNKFYYNRLDKQVLLTTEEKSYIADTNVISVGYLDGFYPFSYEKDGVFKGLTRTLLEEALEPLGLTLEYQKLDSQKETETALQAGTIDVMAYCTEDGEILKGKELSAVGKYAEVPLVFVMKQSGSLNEIEALATVSYLTTEAGAVIDLEGVSLIECETQQECLPLLKNGEVDAVLCDGYLAEYLLKNEFQYNNFQIKNVISSGYFISLAVREEDTYLSGILNKTISTIDAKTMNEYTLKEDSYTLINISDFIEDNSHTIIGGLCLVIIVVILTAQHIIKDSRKIQKLMYKDIKMDIWNLNYLFFWGEHKLLTDSKKSYAMVYINLAQFRRYNVIYGWNAGEKVLESVAEVLKKNTDAKCEICARNQGDRFVMLLNCGNGEVFNARLMYIKEAVEQQIFDDTENRMFVRMGIYYIPKECKDLRLAVNYANQALEFTGNGREEEIIVYDEVLEEKIKERLEREKVLEAVDINKDFVVYYQNKVDIRTEEIVGAEALVRFCDPTAGGMIRAPGYFVPYYEQTGRIMELDFFVLESVCKMLRRRMDAGKRVVTVSCNFSRMHIIKPGFAEHFLSVLEKYEISKDLIEVELTETLIVEEMQNNMVKQTMDILHEKGVRLSIDDFGMGYSSLGIFEQIPASVIKLDRSFLLNQEDRGRQVKIMRGIVKLTEELETQIVCEGVENEEDVHLLEEIGIYVVQGYFYSKPIPEKLFEEKLDD